VRTGFGDRDETVGMRLRPDRLSGVARPNLVGKSAFREGDSGQNRESTEDQIPRNGLAEKGGTEYDGHAS